MKQLVKNLKDSKVLIRSRVILKSGQVSDFYIDMKKAFGNPKAFNSICDEFCKIIDPVKRPGRHGASNKATCIAGSGHGGLPLATAVSIQLGLPLVMVRDKIKKHGLQKMIDGYTPSKEDKIVIIDDVFTTGTCIANSVKILRKTKAKIIGGYVVVNRGDISKFQVPIKSLVGISKLT